MKERTAYHKFRTLMGSLLAVSHNDVKKKLNAEKSAKKRKKARRSSASRAAGGQR